VFLICSMLVTDVVAVLPQQWPGMCRSWFLLDDQLCPGEAMPCVEFAILNLRGLPGPTLSVWTNDATGSQALAPMVSGRAVVLAGRIRYARPGEGPLFERGRACCVDQRAHLVLRARPWIPDLQGFFGAAAVTACCFLTSSLSRGLAGTIDSRL